MKIFLIAVSLLLGNHLLAQSVKVLDDCETVQSENGTWTAGASPVSADTDKKEGKFSISGASKFPERLRKIYTTPLNTGVTVDNGYIAFWLYIENTDLLNGKGNICISSSAAASKDSYNYSVFDFKAGEKVLTNGWNHVVLSLKSFKNVIGSPTLESINYFRVLFFNKSEDSGSQVFKIDNIRFATNAASLN